ncbi:sialate O-acetylesterase [Piscinibacter sp. HJYY11]|uniref:sialate O-acetylesterase n=1 Tax=Piscinibacter sp. HJYY11 TaxID=2801333 RepID=UPI00191E416D|nr:sialate O-acetylesterase [Piscinibacter sp. HJYY11]MBL0730307.1 hypothetical protein [Piscinibacter sp. HJYY11]
MRRIPRAWLLALAALLAATALAGAYVWKRSSGGPPRQVFPPEPLTTDPWGRLLAYPGKQAVACPVQDESTVVLIVAGQSNAANSGALRHTSRHGSRVVNFLDGRCFVAASPLLGADGRSGEYWTLLADRLIDEGKARQVVLAPFSVNGTRIERWQPGGELHAPFLAMLGQLRAVYRPSQVLWHQGESDFLLGTTQTTYADALKALVLGVRSKGIEAPFHVAVASRCLLSAWRADNPVAQAQRAAPDAALRILPGPDADAVWADAHRFDDCHLSAAGQAEMAERWLGVLR